MSVAGEPAIYYPHLGVVSRPPMRIHDVAANLPSTICILKVPSSLLFAFRRKLWLRRHHECGMLNLESAYSHLLSTFMIEEAI
jgi:hypothetical protein